MQNGIGKDSRISEFCRCSCSRFPPAFDIQTLLKDFEVNGQLARCLICPDYSAWVRKANVQRHESNNLHRQRSAKLQADTSRTPVPSLNPAARQATVEDCNDEADSYFDDYSGSQRDNDNHESVSGNAQSLSREDLPPGVWAALMGNLRFSAGEDIEDEMLDTLTTAIRGASLNHDPAWWPDSQEAPQGLDELDVLEDMDDLPIPGMARFCYLRWQF